jgi:phosphomevalonate decarboxylase
LSPRRFGGGVESGRATAVAHPIQGLVKYHGLRDLAARIPYHASISVATAPIHTRTTVTVEDRADGPDTGSIDGVALTGRPLERITAVLDQVRRLARDDRPCRVVSTNDFPARVGLGSSASGFAALAVAGAEAYGLDLSPERLSAIARRGAGSATRSVTGWFSEWVAPGPGQGSEASVSRTLPGARDVPLRTVVALVPCDEPTEGVHRLVTTSPLFGARLAYLPSALARMRIAVAAGDVAEVGRTAETDTLNLHAITMTMDPPRIPWRPPTLAVMQEVRRLREEDDVPCWFSIDTGATVYVNTTAEAEQRVAAALRGIEGVTDTLHLAPGPGARLEAEHLD